MNDASYRVVEESNWITVALTGDMDRQASPDARLLLLDAIKRGKPVLVDLSAVDYMDSSGAASLVEALALSRDTGTWFALASVSDAAMRVLKLARLDQVFQVYPSLDEARGATS